MNKSIIINKTEFHYKEAGEGKVLVLLHGNSSSSSYYEEEIKFFSQYYRVIAMDSRGHGKSGWGKKKLTIETMAGDVRSFLQALQIEKAFLFGFSDGGNIALQYGVLYDDLVEGMVIISANTYPEGLKKKERIILGILHGVAKFAALFSEIGKRFSHRIRLMTEDPKIELQELKKIKVPVLLITGENDVVEIEHIQDIKNHLPKAQLKIIEKAGHNLLKEYPEKLNTIIKDFLDSFQ